MHVLNLHRGKHYMTGKKIFYREMELHSQIHNALMIIMLEELTEAKGSPFPDECDSI